MASLQDKIVVITGGGGVLGREMVFTLAGHGAKIAILGRTQEPLDEVVIQISKKGGHALGVTCDVLKKEDLERAQSIIEDKWGSCNILINGAGGNHPRGTTSKDFMDLSDLEDQSVKSFFDLEPDGVEFVFDLNFLGTFLTCQVFGKAMVGIENATIINISSMSAYLPLTQIPAYSAAKAAVSNFTQWLAVHFSKIGIRVNAIAPGFFVTKQNVRLLTNEDGSPTARGQRILSQTPMGRFGLPADLNSTLLYLCDDTSEFVTGVVIPVDGGFSAYSGV